MKTLKKAFYFPLLILILISATVYADGAPNDACDGELISELNNIAITTSHTESGTVNELTDINDYYYFDISQAGTVSINYNSSLITDFYFSRDINGCGHDKVLNNGTSSTRSLSVSAGRRVYMRVRAENNANTTYSMALTFTPYLQIYQ